MTAEPIMVSGFGALGVVPPKHVPANDNVPGHRKLYSWTGEAAKAVPFYAVDPGSSAALEPTCDDLATTTFAPIEQLPDSRHGEWMQTYTGRRFWPLDPRESEVHIEDIAHSLAMQCRYAGHSLKFYCPTPEQRILTDDLRWVPAGDLKVGDGLFAFDEEPHRAGSFGKNRRRMKRAKVTFATPVRRQTIRLVMEDGSDVTTSAEHPWLVATKASGNQKWVTARDIANDLRLGRTRHIHRYFSPWKERKSREAGWLSGIYDGEGHLSTKNRRGIQMGVAQNPGIVLDAITETLTNFGYTDFRLAPAGATTSKVMNLQMKGGFREIASLLGSLRPIRLLDKFTTALRDGTFDKQLQSDGNPLRIVAAHDEGEQWVAGLETSSRTYFCEGFAAHNCVAEHSIHIAWWLYRHAGPLTALQGLLHDASEAYLVDVPRPVKPYLAGYKEAEAKVQAVIMKRYNLPVEMPPAVKEADDRIIGDEMVNLKPMDWHARYDDPLGITLMYLSPDEAEAKFLASFRALTEELAGVAV